MKDTMLREITKGDQITFAKRGTGHGHNPTLGFGVVSEVHEHYVLVYNGGERVTGAHRVLVITEMPL